MSAPGNENKRKRTAAPKLVDPNNKGLSALPSHKAAHEAAERVAREKAEREARAIDNRGSSLSPSSPTTTSATLPSTTRTRHGSASIEEIEDEDSPSDASSATPPPKKKHKKTAKKKKPTKTKPSAASAATNKSRNAPTTSRHEQATAGLSEEPESEEEESAPGCENKTCDVDEFFGDVIWVGPAGKKKLKRPCFLCPSKDKTIVADVTTLQRHLEYAHEGKYNSWCLKNNYESKLPGAVKAGKEALEVAEGWQGTLDDAVEENANIIPYTRALFEEAAEDWLIETGQPLDALSHPRFHYMVDVASRAMNGVKVPEKRATRAHLIARFKKNMSELHKCLNSDAVKGKVSLTCDAWQASNRDAYFAVTRHWVEEDKKGQWSLQSALLGFTQMNTAHNGVRLGRALHRIVKRVGIAHKVGAVTCDNASNNTTMLEHFEMVINAAHPWERQALEIQGQPYTALISTYSKSPHHDPSSEPSVNDGIAADAALARNEVGLLRCIGVKMRSSAKRSALFKELQAKDGVKIPCMLLIDMKVRWSSTHAMLQRGYELRKKKILDLRLTEAEWDRIAETAQQAFSSETEPTLYNGLPALERLHKAWSSRAGRPKYAAFQPALEAAYEKIATYYSKTDMVDAYTMSMILDPSSKTNHFQKHWGQELELDVRRDAERVFKLRWMDMYGTTMPPPLTTSASNSRLDDVPSDDEDDSTPTSAQPASTADKPWLPEFNAYMDGSDIRPEGQSMVAWWALHAKRLPVWASLARDYLAIMASSVSSERAFSAAGITISKRCNRLKKDIVEALQILKSLLQKDLMFREPLFTSTWELENEDIIEDDGDSAWVDEVEGDDYKSDDTWSSPIVL
ncbi:hypothetical protein D9611_006951 [Ephemerocybe angulata]|uniref:HAT C-terminal dimerisation domain-containing protein n=1 Tax=Ephemerocybe angulata TaxID=980116 RepID=A0A8H5B111_9AGAR|nr:hypothetical protein D9611_006951 [Tulosesus angulatus]